MTLSCKFSGQIPCNFKACLTHRHNKFIIYSFCYFKSRIHANYKQDRHVKDNSINYLLKNLKKTKLIVKKNPAFLKKKKNDKEPTYFTRSNAP